MQVLEETIKNVTGFAREYVNQHGEFSPMGIVVVENENAEGQVETDLMIVEAPEDFNPTSKMRWCDNIKKLIQHLTQDRQVPVEKIAVLIAVEAWFVRMNNADFNENAISVPVSQMESRAEGVCFTVETKNQSRLWISEIQRFDDGVKLGDAELHYDSTDAAGKMGGSFTGFFDF